MKENEHIFAAFVKAQAGFAPALKTSVNPHFRSKYADLAACIEAVIDSLNRNDIGLIQKTHKDETGVTVETIFVHSSGQSMSGGALHVPAAKNDPQGYGSALSYARRYSLMAACGIAPEDDDGNAAAKSAPKSDHRTEPKADLPPIVSPERQQIIRRVADACIAKHAAGNEYGAYEEACAITDVEERLMLWSHLRPHSAVRSAIKRQAEMAKEPTPVEA